MKWYDMMWYDMVCSAWPTSKLCTRAVLPHAVPRSLQTPVREQYASGPAGSKLVADVALEIASNLRSRSAACSACANELRIGRSLSNSISNKIERGLTLAACCGHSIIVSPKFVRHLGFKRAIHGRSCVDESEKIKLNSLSVLKPNPDKGLHATSSTVSRAAGRAVFVSRCQRNAKIRCTS